MTTTTSALDHSLTTRILAEGYGPGAWHGSDLKAALADVTVPAAYWRPGPGRHNIAEIALHHAWCVRSVISKLTGKAPAPEPFVLEGEDWFEVSNERRLTWPAITTLVAEQQRRLVQASEAIAAGGITSPLPERERFDLTLGITCHAIYHAGQIQLLKVLGAR